MSIATEITRLQGAKASLKTAIEAKGVTVPSSTKLEGYSSLVGQIQGGGGTYTQLTATANGTYTAPTGYDAFDSVTVAIPTYDGSVS